MSDPSSSVSPPIITRIPLLQKIFLFSTIKISTLSRFACVHSSWQDCCHNYSRGIFASWINPSRTTLDDLIQQEITNKRNQILKKSNASSEEDLVALETVSDHPEAFLQTVQEARQREARRMLSGGLVRGCQFGILWLVTNILESPSPFSATHNINRGDHRYDLNRNAKRNGNDDNHDSEDVCSMINEYENRSFIIDPVKCTFYAGTPIFAAVSGGHHDVVRYLIEKTNGAVVCSRKKDPTNPGLIYTEHVLDLNERTPLFSAAARGPEMMAIILDAGCDHRILDYAGDDVVNFCAAQGYLESLKWLMETRLPQLKRR